MSFSTLYRSARDRDEDRAFRCKQRNSFRFLSNESDWGLIDFVKECAKQKLPFARSQLRLEAALLGHNTGKTWASEGNEVN